MKNRDKGQAPSIKNTFNRRAKRPSRLKRFILFAAMVVGINTVMNLDSYEKQWLKDKFIDAGQRDELTVGERRALGRHVPEGFHDRHIRNFPDFGYNQRTHVPPADARLVKLQEALIDAMPANDNAHIKKLQELPLAEAEKYANMLIADESFMQSFKQLESVEQLELGAAILFALRNGGMTEAEKEFQTWFVLNYEPPQNYQDWLDQRIDALAAELGNDAFLQDNLSQWVPRYTYHSVEEAEEQYKLRHAALQYVADKVLEKFGYDRVPVFLSVNGQDLDPDVNPDRMKATLGLFSFVMSAKGGEFILINYFDPSVEMAIESTLSDPKRALKTILEEAKHATDVFTVQEVFNGKISRDDPRYAHGLALFVNHSGEYNEVKYVNVPLLGKVAVGGAEYAEQYVERTAKEFAAEVAESIGKKPKKPARPAPRPMS